MNNRFKFRVPVLDFNYNFIEFKYINWWEECCDDYEPQICIGVDENKNLVFCGDIIQNVNTGKLFIIEWDEKNYRYIGKGIEKDNKDNICYINLKNQRVIGNIYENKELLESEG